MNILKNLFGIGSRINYKDLIEQGAIIIDVRTKGEFNSGHIKGSINISLDLIQSESSKLDKNKIIITCCASGIRSANSKNILKAKGFKNVYNGGGWQSLERNIKS